MSVLEFLNAYMASATPVHKLQPWSVEPTKQRKAASKTTYGEHATDYLDWSGVIVKHVVHIRCHELHPTKGWRSHHFKTIEGMGPAPEYGVYLKRERLA